MNLVWIYPFLTDSQRVTPARARLSTPTTIPTISAELKSSLLDVFPVAPGTVDVTGEGGVVVVVEVNKVEGESSGVIAELSACVEVFCFVSMVSSGSFSCVGSGAIVDSGGLVLEVLGLDLPTRIAVSICNVRIVGTW